MNNINKALWMFTEKEKIVAGYQKSHPEFPGEKFEIVDIHSKVRGPGILVVDENDNPISVFSFEKAMQYAGMESF